MDTPTNSSHRMPQLQTNPSVNRSVTWRLLAARAAHMATLPVLLVGVHTIAGKITRRGRREWQR
ncbi:MAG TPA: hypothetical protein VE569_08205 [Acidimicrobiia bacterium]|nr:hypothetical protein [Acidimicrobiia bacterium]